MRRGGERGFFTAFLSDRSHNTLQEELGLVADHVVSFIFHCVKLHKLPALQARAGPSSGNAFLHATMKTLGGHLHPFRLQRGLFKSHASLMTLLRIPFCAAVGLYVYFLLELRRMRRLQARASLVHNKETINNRKATAAIRSTGPSSPMADAHELWLQARKQLSGEWRAWRGQV